MTKTELDIRLTKIFSTAAIALATPDKRAVCKQLKQFDKEARALWLSRTGRRSLPDALATGCRVTADQGR